MEYRRFILHHNKLQLSFSSKQDESLSNHGLSKWILPEWQDDMFRRNFGACTNYSCLRDDWKLECPCCSCEGRHQQPIGLSFWHYQALDGATLAQQAIEHDLPWSNRDQQVHFAWHRSSFPYCWTFRRGCTRRLCISRSNRMRGASPLDCNKETRALELWLYQVSCDKVRLLSFTLLCTHLMLSYIFYAVTLVGLVGGEVVQLRLNRAPTLRSRQASLLATQVDKVVRYFTEVTLWCWRIHCFVITLPK